MMNKRAHETRPTLLCECYIIAIEKHTASLQKQRPRKTGLRAHELPQTKKCNLLNPTAPSTSRFCVWCRFPRQADANSMRGRGFEGTRQPSLSETCRKTTVTKGAVANLRRCGTIFWRNGNNTFLRVKFSPLYSIQSKRVAIHRSILLSPPTQSRYRQKPGSHYRH